MFQNQTTSSQTSEAHDLSAHANLVALAKTEASRMRSEAIREFGAQAYANFWHDTHAVWQRMESSLHSATHSARRLQARMNRRQSHTHSA